MALVVSDNLIASVSDILGDGSLFLGGEPLTPAEWDVVFTKHKVKHVVRCIPAPPDDDARLTLEARGEGFRLLHLKLHDIPSFNISPYFEAAADFIAQALQVDEATELGSVTKGPVFVHCAAGVSRSATILAAYFVHKKGYSVAKALDTLQRARPVVRPNIGFLKALCDLEVAKNGGEPTVDVSDYVIDGATARFGNLCPPSVLREIYFSPECGKNDQRLNMLVFEWATDTGAIQNVLQKVHKELGLDLAVVESNGGKVKLDPAVERVRPLYIECGKDVTVFQKRLLEEMQKEIEQ